MQSSIPETAETKRTALDSRSRFRTSEQSSSMDNESDLPHCFALKSKRNPIICNRKQSKARRVQLMSRCPRFVCLFCGECILVLHTEAKPSAVCHSAGLPTESVTVAEALSTVLPHGPVRVTIGCRQYLVWRREQYVCQQVQRFQDRAEPKALRVAAVAREIA